MGKRLGAIVILLLLVIGTASAQATPVAQATDELTVSGEDITPRYVLISSIHGNTTVKNGKVYLTGTVSGDCTYAKVTVTLQYFSGGKWHDDISRSATGTKSATKSTSTTATPGMIYRTKIYGYVSKGSVSDSDTIYTKVVGA